MQCDTLVWSDKWRASHVDELQTAAIQNLQGIDSRRGILLAKYYGGLMGASFVRTGLFVQTALFDKIRGSMYCQPHTEQEWDPHIRCRIFCLPICYPNIKIALLLLLSLYDMDISCHRPFLPGTSVEPAVIPTAHASSVTLQHFPYYVWCSKYSCLL